MQHEIVEGETIDERLQGRSSGTNGPGAIHLPCARRKVILGTDQRDDVTSRVIDHDRGAIAHILFTQLREPFSQNFFHLLVKTKIERGP